MMFIVRTDGRGPADPHVRIALRRQTPEIVPESHGLTDLFCVGDDDAPERLRGQGWAVVPLRDGWYQDDGDGGVAIWGQGQYWEIRDTPLTVREASGPTGDSENRGSAGDALDVRRGIFGV